MGEWGLQHIKYRKSDSQPRRCRRHRTFRRHRRRRRRGVEDILEAPGLLLADVLPQVVVLDALRRALGAEVGRYPRKVLVVAQEALVKPVHLGLRPRRRLRGRLHRRGRHERPQRHVDVAPVLGERLKR